MTKWEGTWLRLLSFGGFSACAVCKYKFWLLFWRSFLVLEMLQKWESQVELSSQKVSCIFVVQYLNDSWNQ